MHHFQSFILTRGGLGPFRFVLAISGVYAIGLAGQWLTAPPLLSRFGLWPFLLVQLVLIWLWYVLHARRLRDAALNIAPAQGIAVIHVLAIVLLVLVGAFYMESLPVAGWAPQSFLLVEQLITFNRGAGDFLTILGLVACAALLVPPAFSIWAAMQPESRA